MKTISEMYANGQTNPKDIFLMLESRIVALESKAESGVTQENVDAELKKMLDAGLDSIGPDKPK